MEGCRNRSAREGGSWACRRQRQAGEARRPATVFAGTGDQRRSRPPSQERPVRLHTDHPSPASPSTASPTGPGSGTGTNANDRIVASYPVAV